MSESVRRAAANEAIFRTVNEQIEQLERGIAQASDNKMHIICECSAMDCADKLAVAIGDYEEIRSDPTLFFVQPGHERLELEHVVDEAAAYRVVRKRPGEGARIAQQTDPRPS
ncbi:MAG: hypothetical protein QOH95_2889 [Gaiellaceae bacterium]|nr:hypothetical protein [Gaiellaceae bacterium]